MFMNYENSKTSNSHRLLLNLSDKINLKTSGKYLALPSLSICYTMKNIKKSYNNNKFKISTPMWNKKFELPDGSYLISDIQNHSKYVTEKHETVTGNPPIRM